MSAAANPAPAPTPSTATTVGPYRLTGPPIHNRNGCEILPVNHPDLPGDWVLKVKHDNQYDIDWIPHLQAHNVRNCIEFPSPDVAPVSGVLESGREWYAMRRYDGDVQNNEWFRPRWKQIAIDVLDFLEDIHTKLGAAHLDIKSYNLLVNKDEETFHVCDFEHMTHMDDFNHETPLKDYSDEYKWYYTMLGGDWDQPRDAWRMDFEALGFVLAMLTWRRGFSISFADECRVRMAGGGTPTMTNEDVMRARANEIAYNADEKVLEYFATIEGLSWTAKEPPSAAFYDELRTLFR